MSAPAARRSPTTCNEDASQCQQFQRAATLLLTSTGVNGTQLNSLASGTAFGNLGGGARRFMAIGSNGTKGRVLSTNLTAPASQVQP
jgi:hypothetical protein